MRDTYHIKSQPEKVTGGLKRQQVANEMGYSEREVLRFHGDALVEMEKIIENEQ